MTRRVIEIITMRVIERDYIEFFKDSIRKSFEDMFEEEIILESETSAPRWISSKGAAVIIGISGVKKGRVLLDMCLDTALELAQKLDSDFNDEDLALFTIAEFCNIASGGAITMINDKFSGRGLRLASPSIFAGTNARLFSPKLDSVLLSYYTRFGNIDFYIGFGGE
ncbi:MAG: chemotaxis protein CheX [Firmicutes bacterium]|nr:chemotaxis protein CheX [Bacillota bacterium]